MEIEGIFSTHPLIEECAVVGVADKEWGEKVCAAVVLRSHSSLLEAEPATAGLFLALDDRILPDHLRHWGKERLAPYKVPCEFLIVTKLPRNVMGKVIKTTVKNWFPSL